jgi:TonB family protein
VITLKPLIGTWLTVATLATVAAQAPDAPRVAPADVGTHVGSIATVCGQVVTYHCARPDSPTFLDLNSPYWSDGVSIRMPANTRSLFGPRVEDQYAQRNVCATGRIEQDKNRYVIAVDGLDALRFDDEQPPLVSVLDAGAVRACDAGVELPRATRQPQPDYTRAAVVNHVEGTVLLEAVLLTNGNPGEIRVLRSVDAGLDQEAVRTFRSWRFSPARQGGRPVRVIVTVQMKFSMDDR